MKHIFTFIFLVIIGYQSLLAQGSRRDNNTVTYEQLYDDPYQLNKLFIHVQPMYGELFVANVNAGFGLELEYYHKDKFHAWAAGRTTYARSTDFERSNHARNGTSVNTPFNFFYLEAGGAYHFNDSETDGESKIVLYSARFNKGNRWASSVPDKIKVPSKVRTIMAARLSSFFYSTTTDLARVADRRDFVLVNQNGGEMPENERPFLNYNAFGFHLGASMGWFRNVAIKPDRNYPVLLNDNIFTVYADISIAPFMEVQDIRVDTASGLIYDVGDVPMNVFGGRAGIQGKFNRALGWGYNIETGYRPGVASRGFFATLRVSIPIFSTDLDYTKEAFGNR
ncbi:MAG: hypothetical protein LAT68_03550 [Cyclobacteriaceae bacterium]|nr:hypothetical protein [Cyclobacteriaceae bacterium]MCH8515384.1 hypothetical protein [Cyclobacteriaceae bacterium]